MGMGANATMGAFVNFTETYAASASSSGTLTEPVVIAAGASSLQSGTQLTVGTGTATSINEQVSGALSLSVSTPVTVNLFAFTGPAGSKVLTKCRGFIVKNTGSNPVTLKASASSGWTNGPIPTAGVLIPVGGTIYFDNPSIAGWTVATGNKNVDFDPGAALGAVSYCFMGE
jgi:hypothetical protein